MSVYMTPATFSLDRLLIILKINCPLNEGLLRQLTFCIAAGHNMSYKNIEIIKSLGYPFSN